MSFAKLLFRIPSRIRRHLLPGRKYFTHRRKGRQVVCANEPENRIGTAGLVLVTWGGKSGTLASVVRWNLCPPAETGEHK
jgi:hypothetical protein